MGQNEALSAQFGLHTEKTTPASSFSFCLLALKKVAHSSIRLTAPAPAPHIRKLQYKFLEVELFNSTNIWSNYKKFNFTFNLHQELELQVHPLMENTKIFNSRILEHLIALLVQQQNEMNVPDDGILTLVQDYFFNLINQFKIKEKVRSIQFFQKTRKLSETKKSHRIFSCHYYV